MACWRKLELEKASFSIKPKFIQDKVYAYRIFKENSEYEINFCPTD